MAKAAVVMCGECGVAIPSHVRDCIACGAAVGYPNVRAAETSEEREALDKRLEVAFVSADAAGYSEILERFGQAVLTSKAVMARNLNTLDALVNNDHLLVATYHKMFRSGARMPQDSAWDRGRVAAESTIHPHYYEEIQYCALSLDGKGLSSFGDYFVSFKESMIAKRATVFEENPFIFCDRQRVVAGASPPQGFRAIWPDRSRLAQAKLYYRLSSDSLDSDFARILLREEANPRECDFVEVHIYGQLHRSAIERVIGPTPTGSDRHIWRQIKRQLTELGVQVEEI